MSIRAIRFADFHTVSEFLKRFNEQKKSFGEEKIAILVVDPLQVLEGDIFYDLALASGVKLISSGSPLLSQRYVRTQKLRIKARQLPKEEPPAGATDHPEEKKDDPAHKPKDKAAPLTSKDGNKDSSKNLIKKPK